ncbi:hypothetical protein C8F04DRAFT_1263382 [Mycena alexandri]|uniref:Uncharacterized protein n=1 Tax=Mycena alexandri TaxID=1745969 RepID=A0AAD6X119_9AGAR|nr:hypothetical protein C8F04DRAFT_1263382 [Mycena alexandri]
MSSTEHTGRASPISVPTTDELTTTQKSLPSSTPHLTTAEEDVLLLTNYFERIGRRQRIHEAAVHHHLKYRSKDSLALVVSTFDGLYRIEMQVPPPLIGEDTPKVDAKACIARGRALAFAEDPLETEQVWAYNNRIDGERLETAWAEANPNSNDADRAAPSSPARHTAFSLDEAKQALDRVQELARRLLPQPGSNCDLLD